jgi:hypothetical protein
LNDTGDIYLSKSSYVKNFADSYVMYGIITALLGKRKNVVKLVSALATLNDGSKGQPRIQGGGVQQVQLHPQDESTVHFSRPVSRRV